MTYICMVRPFHSSFLAANSKATRVALYYCLAKEKAVYNLSDTQVEGTEELREGEVSHNFWDLARVQG